MEDFSDYHNHLVRASQKAGFPTETPSIRFSTARAFNAEVHRAEQQEGLTHAEAVEAVSNIWMAPRVFEDELEDDDLDDEGE